MSTTLLTAAETADYLRISEPHLRKLRQRGDGPPHIKLGARVIYRQDAIDAFLADVEVRS